MIFVSKRHIYCSWIYGRQMPLLAFYCNASLLPARKRDDEDPEYVARTWRREDGSFPEETKRYIRNNART